MQVNARYINSTKGISYNCFFNWTVLGSMQILILHTTILIMEICKAPTPQLKALNKHTTHNVPRDGKYYQQFNKN